jgi:hypothetical protein
MRAANEPPTRGDLGDRGRNDESPAMCRAFEAGWTGLEGVAASEPKCAMALGFPFQLARLEPSTAQWLPNRFPPFRTASDKFWAAIGQ